MAKKTTAVEEPVTPALPDGVGDFPTQLIEPVDPATLEPKPVAPPPETTKMVDVVYMPGPEGPDETSVAGVPFRAYEPVQVSVARPEVTKLHDNPWFGPKVDTDRQKAWKDYREKQAAARKAQEDADALLKT